MEFPKFVFTCQRTGRCCETRDGIDVYLDDIEQWWKNGSFAKIYPELRIVADGGLPLKMQIQKADACPFLENRNCSIYEIRPISCQAFPLGFNGTNFTLTDEECPGVGKGEMTAEKLEEMRDAARTEHHAKIKTSTILPALQAIILKETMKHSEDALEQLSDKDKEKLKEIFGDAK